MTGGWAATNTLRAAMDAEQDGFCAWCQCSIYEQPHASECEGQRALSALALVEAALDAAERYIERGGVPEHDALAAALRAVREGE